MSDNALHRTTGADSGDGNEETIAGVTAANLSERDVNPTEPGKPFHDLAQWATKAPEGEHLISTAYGDKVREDLEFVENKPGVHKPDPILVADKVTRRFGGMTAVDVDHFEIERHGITALIGPNGAGKTTFFNLMTGFDTPNTGSWQFDAKDLAHVHPEQVARMGMVRTFQLTKVMSRLTVLDNMLLGAPVQPGEGMFRALIPGLWRRQEKANIDKAEALLERFLLIKKKNDFAGSLSGGQRKLLEMARALMSDPQLVMLDEPMAGVNPALKQSLLDHIMALREEGTTVLFVEHDINMVRHIADWVTVMAEGRIVAEGRPKTVMNDPAVIDAYLGSHANIDLGDDSVVADLEAGDANGPGSVGSVGSADEQKGEH
ncbi:ABC transporter ATP-binding protein [Bifidobacterium callitrichos]|uniref:ABC transporter ATP-binding protein n=1 Tax=Bifidobacterium callitrichos TaxID=762209 RepID=A0A2T3GC92_9BIFI|nr:ABC transporter ATP-binding protein [Bifidobacterium callitrichos]PST47079.1 ABC transporter ATP-binding protein [Bifidobacterium callitrichos]